MASRVQRPSIRRSAQALALWTALAGMHGAHAQLAAVPGAPMQPSILANAARAVGVVQCQPAIARLSALAIQGSKSHDVLLDWDRTPGKADKSPVFSLMGIEYLNGAVAATVTGVPTPEGGCTVMAERISVAPFTCRSIADVELKNYQANALLANFNVYVDPADPGSSVSLIDSPPGCLVIRRYVQYSWTPPAPAAPGTPQR